MTSEETYNPQVDIAVLKEQMRTMQDSQLRMQTDVNTKMAVMQADLSKLLVVYNNGALVKYLVHGAMAVAYGASGWFAKTFHG